MKNESFYTTLLDHIDEAVVVTNALDKIIYVNTKLCYLVGRTSDELLGEDEYIFLDEKSKKKVAHINKTERKNWESSIYQLTIITKLGNSVPVSLKGIPTPEWGTIGIMTDIREKKARDENEKILYNALQFSNDGMIITKKDGTITFWNKGAQLIFWYKHDDIIQQNIGRIVSKKDIQVLLNQENESVVRYDIFAKTNKSKKIQISLTQTPIMDKNKTEITAHLLVCRDITNHRKLEADIQEKYNKVQSAYTILGYIRRQMEYTYELLNIYEQFWGDTQKVADYIVSSVIMLTHVDGCELWVYHESNDSIDMLSHFWFSQDWSWKKKIRFKNSLAEKAFLQKTPLRIVDIYKEPKYQTPHLARKHGMTSLLLIPLTSQWKFIGLLSLYAKSNSQLEIFENKFIERYAKIIQFILVLMYKK